MSALERLQERLLAARGGHAHWTGELSSSALSTATAVMALHLEGRNRALVDGGLDWLERTQNADGGFGDTTLSLSNLSTTALCWAAFTLCGRQGPGAERAVAWMARAAGGTGARDLVAALAARYGADRTFSVPILTVLAVAGIVPWPMVPQLPFELAAFPRGWFAAMGLPVVSYALPALIAIGQLRHRRCPTQNPAARLARALAGRRTLRILESIQPPNGGFLEAIPLTSFVSISLLAGGVQAGAVLERGIGFLRQSVRPDGSWPIDTNLATWATTLSVNALGDRLPVSCRQEIAAWLLGQQFRTVHPYTGAAPGGWAWTDLPGGVPDADDTAGALVALHTLGVGGGEVLGAARAGVGWLLGLQNADGGIPTFCRGWGKLPFDRSSADITAHALQAWAVWGPVLDESERMRVEAAMGRAVAFLERTQRPGGEWVPLWFGNQFAANDENPVYGTSRVLAGLRRAWPQSPAIARGAAWLCRAQGEDGGWGGARGVAPSVEETAVAVSALAGMPGVDQQNAVRRGVAWLEEATAGGERTTASPIGLYFARLWYYEALYPLIFAVDALGRGGRAAP